MSIQGSFYEDGYAVYQQGDIITVTKGNVNNAVHTVNISGAVNRGLDFTASDFHRYVVVYEVGTEAGVCGDILWNNLKENVAHNLCSREFYEQNMAI